MILYQNTVREKASFTGGVRNLGVARQEQVRILRMGYTDTMPTEWLVLLTGRSWRELQPDVEPDETKAERMRSQAWQACSQRVTSLHTCSRAMPVAARSLGCSACVTSRLARGTNGIWDGRKEDHALDYSTAGS